MATIEQYEARLRELIDFATDQYLMAYLKTIESVGVTPEDVARIAIATACYSIMAGVTVEAGTVQISKEAKAAKERMIASAAIN